MLLRSFAWYMKVAIAAAVAIGGTAFALLIGGQLLALLFALLCVDKILFARYLQWAGELGFELVTIPTILAGVIFGPVGGFFFGFVALAVLGDLLQWSFAPPFEPGWPPFIPSIDTFIAGLVAASAALLYPFLGFVAVVVAGVFIKNIIYQIKDAAFGAEITAMSVVGMKFWMNLGFNILVALILSAYFVGLV